MIDLETTTLIFVFFFGYPFFVYESMFFNEYLQVVFQQGTNSFNGCLHISSSMSRTHVFKFWIMAPHVVHLLGYWIHILLSAYVVGSIWMPLKSQDSFEKKHEPHI